VRVLDDPDGVLDIRRAIADRGIGKVCTRAARPLHDGRCRGSGAGLLPAPEQVCCVVHLKVAIAVLVDKLGGYGRGRGAGAQVLLAAGRTCHNGNHACAVSVHARIIVVAMLHHKIVVRVRAGVVCSKATRARVKREKITATVC